MLPSSIWKLPIDYLIGNIKVLMMKNDVNYISNIDNIVV